MADLSSARTQIRAFGAMTGRRYGSFSGRVFVNGPIIFNAATIYRPGMQVGATYKPGGQQEVIYKPGSQAGALSE